MAHANFDIQALQQTTSKGLLALIWLHLPLLFAIAVTIGRPWLMTEVIALALAAAATGTWLVSPHRLDTRLTVAVAFVGMVSLVVYQLAGRAWQLDSHMYFFAALAVLAAYCDWRVLLMAAGAIALHHLTLNFLLPAAVYPGGSDFGRVMLHAAIVVLETAALVWLTHRLATSFAVSHAAVQSAETARSAEAAAHAREADLQANAQAAGHEARHGLTKRFDSDVGALVRDVAGAVSMVHDGAEVVSATAQEAAARTAAIASASRDTAMNVQAVATATEALSTSVSGTGGHVARAAQIAREAVAQTVDTSGTMKRLADSAERIEAVVKLINGIAGQTNLLALNATIEAARAAEAGKGFAVVASEVKTLATQTARATEDIKTQIAGIQAETDRGVTAIAGITQVIADLGGITASIAAAIEQQGVATTEIARSAHQAALGRRRFPATWRR